jgi:hypothetical protein
MFLKLIPSLGEVMSLPVCVKLKHDALTLSEFVSLHRRNSVFPMRHNYHTASRLHETHIKESSEQYGTNNAEVASCWVAGLRQT